MKRGDRLGPYRLEAPIGEGGMGAVWKALDTRLDRLVAVKVAKQDFTERFEREARAVAALNHPHISQLYDVGPNYLVMEYIEGAPLKGPLPPAKAIEYGRQILEALGAAHKKGITHRDLKPANILVTKSGQIKLLDFGIAKRSEAKPQETDATRTATAAATPLTAEGAIVGTLHYMAPEQLQGKDAGPRGDLFSFGCVLYELLSGKRAFEGASAASIIAAVLEREPPAIDGVDPALGRLIQRCLAKDPDERFQTAADLQYNLGLVGTATHAAPPVASRRGGLPLAATAAAALLLGALGGWGISRIGQAPAAASSSSGAAGARLRMDPPENGAFIAGNFDVSPDGRNLAFVANVAGKSGLWIRSLDAPAARRITGTDGAAQPFWSPDSRTVGYFAASKLWRVAADGASAPLAVCDAPVARGGAWLSDGQTIVWGTAGGGLRQVNAAASGGSVAPAALTNIDAAKGEYSHRWPSPLPDGRLLYWVGSGKAGGSGIAAFDAAKPGEAKLLVANPTNGFFAGGYLLWKQGAGLVAQPFDPALLRLSGEVQPVTNLVGGSAANGRLNAAGSSGGTLFAGAGYNPPSQLTWVDRAGGKPVGTEGEPGEYFSLALSRDGRRIVASRGGVEGTDLWIAETGREQWSLFTTAPGLNDSPVWSADGKTILFRSGGSPLNLFRRETNGAGAETRVTRSANTQWPSDWSRDGRTVLYYELAPDTKFDIWLLPMDGGGEARPWMRTPFNEQMARFSPEPSPRWIAYQSDETGRNEVYVQGYPEPRGKWRVSVNGGANPQWSGDGREIFYFSPDSKFMAAGVDLRGDRVAVSAPREIVQLAGNAEAGASYAVTPDGRRLLVRLNVKSAPPPLEAMVNWTGLLLGQRR